MVGVGREESGGNIPEIFKVQLINMDLCPVIAPIAYISCHVWKERCEVANGKTTLFCTLMSGCMSFFLLYLFTFFLLLIFPLVRFLNLVRPFLPILPEVSSPDRKVRLFQVLIVINPNACEIGPFQPKGAMDSCHSPHFLGLLSSSPLRNHVVGLFRSALLDACHYGV